MADYFGSDPRSAGRGAEFGAISGYFHVMRNLGRNAQGRFTSFQTVGKDLNRRAAEDLQELVVAKMGQRYKRPGVSTGRLRDATAAAGNRRSGLDYAYVGIEDHLAKSQAKYWRTIEFGSAEVWSHPFVGTRLLGWFGESIGGFYENRWGTVPFGDEPFTRPGEGSGGKFRPYNRATAVALKGSGVRSGRGTVRHEIEPVHAYRDAWRSFGGRGRLEQQLKERLRRLMG